MGIPHSRSLRRADCKMITTSRIQKKLLSAGVRWKVVPKVAAKGISRTASPVKGGVAVTVAILDGTQLAGEVVKEASFLMLTHLGIWTTAIARASMRPAPPRGKARRRRTRSEIRWARFRGGVSRWGKRAVSAVEVAKSPRKAAIKLAASPYLKWRSREYDKVWRRRPEKRSRRRRHNFEATEGTAGDVRRDRDGPAGDLRPPQG